MIASTPAKTPAAISIDVAPARPPGHVLEHVGRQLHAGRASRSLHFGRIPVARKRRTPCRRALMPVRSNTKMSCIVITSPSMPVISVMAVTLRVPSDMRSTWTTRLIADAICWRIARSGHVEVGHRHHRVEAVQRVARAVGVDGRQAAVVAGVHGLQHVERLVAADLADDDAVRPHAQRVDRRAARCRTAPLPSMFGGRVSSRTTCRCCSSSSAASSIVTMRSVSEMKPDRTLSSVVLPAPVPPETMMFSRQATAALRKSSIGCVSESRVDQVLRRRAGRSEIAGSTATGPSSASGGMMALTREPSAQPRVDHRARFVDAPADRADDPLDDPHAGARSSLKTTSTGSSRPFALDVDLVEAVDQDVRDRRDPRSSASSGPRPNSSFRTSPTSDSRSRRLSGVVCALCVQHPAMTPRISGSASSRLDLRQPLEVEAVEQPLVDAALQFLITLLARVGHRR